MAWRSSLPDQFKGVQKKWEQLISLPDFVRGKNRPQIPENKATKSYDAGVTVENAYTATDTFDEDYFLGAAHLTLLNADFAEFKSLQSSKKLLPKDVADIITTGLVKVDLIITGISYQYTEYNKISPHIGETFSAHYYGKAPLILTVQGKLVDTVVSNGKRVMTELYTKLFRASRVAIHKLPPVLVFRGAAAVGCFLSMDLSEHSGVEDVVDFSCQFLVFSLAYSNPDNTGRSKQVRIEYDRTKGVRRTDLRYPDYGPKDKTVDPDGVRKVQKPGNVYGVHSSDNGPLFGSGGELGSIKVHAVEVEE